MNNKTRHVFHDVTLGDLGQIRHYVRDTAVVHACNEAAVDELIVAVNEALENIIRHSYQNKPGKIEAAISCNNKMITVQLLDDGPDFDPTKTSSPDTTLPLAERPLGGMGIHLMRDFCDELRYRRDEDNRNELTLLKRIDG